MLENKVKFEPGAARHGNFINYYSFNPAEERIKALPQFLWDFDGEQDLVCLDVGCNSGELTRALYAAYNATPRKKNFYLLGVDIDPILIQRASEHPSDNVKFVCTNVVDPESYSVFESYLSTYNRTSFNITFMFSVTMWIHLNYGDEGLIRFIKVASERTEVLVVEPQPWKCYKSAIRRMKKLKEDIFQEWHNLKIRETVEEEIERIITKDCGFEKLFESEKSSWGRKILVLKKRGNI